MGNGAGMKSADEKETAMLEWCLRLTYSGMTVDMIRYHMLKKHKELLSSAMRLNLHFPIEEGVEQQGDESAPV